MTGDILNPLRLQQSECEGDQSELALDPAPLRLLGELDRDGSGRILKLAIEKFLAHGAVALAAMDSAAAAGDGAELLRHVHSMKSSSASLGAMALSGQCQAIEREIRGGRLPGEIMAALARLQTLFRAAEQALWAVQQG